MIELPEKVTVVMYKDSRGNLHRTQAEAINSDNYRARTDLTEQMEALVCRDKDLGQAVSFRNDPMEMSERLLEFLSKNLSKVLPIVQAYMRVRKAV